MLQLLLQILSKKINYWVANDHTPENETWLINYNPDFP